MEECEVQKINKNYQDEFLVALLAVLQQSVDGNPPEYSKDARKNALIKRFEKYIQNKAIHEILVANGEALHNFENVMPQPFFDEPSSILISVNSENMEETLSDTVRSSQIFKGEYTRLVEEEEKVSPDSLNHYSGKSPYNHTEFLAEEWVKFNSDYDYFYQFLSPHWQEPYRQHPTAVSEAICLYFYIRAEYDQPISFAYRGLLNSLLEKLSTGPLLKIIVRQPKFFEEEYELELHQYFNDIEPTIPEDFFHLIEHHLFNFMYAATKDLQGYLRLKLRRDSVCQAAKKILDRTVQLIPLNLYCNYDATSAVANYVNEIVSIAEATTGQKFDRLSQGFSLLMYKILANLDRQNVQYLGYPTNYRELVSHKDPKAASGNQVLKLSGSSFSTLPHNHISWFNNAANSEYSDTHGAYYQIMEAINAASRFIFILGWELSPQLIFYKKNDPLTRTLGEMLIDKAFENPDIIIAVMCWGQKVGFTNMGSLTHANALSYFRKLAWQRHGSLALPNNLSVKFVYRHWRHKGFNSHHQKVVMTDCDGHWPGVQAFFGGLDLTTGRFDYQHDLLELDAYRHKYHVAPYGEEDVRERGLGADICNLDVGNPFRTPWCDKHTHMRGLSVFNVMEHFYQHWHAHASTYFFTRKIKQAIDEAKQRIPLKLPSNYKEKEEASDHNYCWNAQLLRSHTKANCSFWQLPTDYENSIMQGYVNIIRKAERFIYIENQYFIGGGHQHENNAFGNVIPDAIVNKILEKHKKRESFHVFIVTPLFPEGGPQSRSDNAVRRQQHQTMENVLKKLNHFTQGQAQRYITFLWFGQWYGKLASYENYAKNYKATRKELIKYAQRYPIYVHSKFMLVDDTYVINGSANINERSMMGIRDSEVAMLMGPMSHTQIECRIQLRQFRYQIWEQYFGKDCLEKLGEDFENPQEERSVRIIQNRAKVNLVKFLNDTLPENTLRSEDGSLGKTAMTGHIMAWPYMMDREYQPLLKQLPDTPLSEANNWAYNWMLGPQEYDFITSMLTNEIR